MGRRRGVKVGKEDVLYGRSIVQAAIELRRYSGKTRRPRLAQLGI